VTKDRIADEVRRLSRQVDYRPRSRVERRIIRPSTPSPIMPSNEAAKINTPSMVMLPGIASSSKVDEHLPALPAPPGRAAAQAVAVGHWRSVPVGRADEHTPPMSAFRVSAGLSGFCRFRRKLLPLLFQLVGFALPLQR
jgi:hypothetical protein